MSGLGILIGLCCGLAHAVTYLFSRRFLTVPGHTSGQLTCLAHIIMGAFSFLLMPFLWVTPHEGWWPVLWPLLGTTLFYLVGQLSLFQAVQVMEASRVAPLLGIKIGFLAVLVTCTGQGTIKPMQWVGVLLAMPAVWLVGFAGRNQGNAPATPWRAYLWIALTGTGYAFSDFFIQYLLEALSTTRNPEISAFAVTLNYGMTGIAVLPLLRRYRHSSAQSWRMAFPFTLGWYASMITLFTTMGMVGVVGAVILQSTRGLWAILFGILLAAWGYHHLEQHLPWRARLIQCGAALIMSLAIACYAGLFGDALPF